MSRLFNVSNYVLGILWLAILAPQLAHQVVFKGKSFSLRSSVFNEPNTFSYNIEESYSVEQRRAKLDYRFTSRDPLLPSSGPEAGIFFVDSSDQITLLFNVIKYKCKESSNEELMNTLGLGSVHSLPNDAEDYIAGPARLLSFLALHRDKMQLVAEQKFHSTDSLLYKLEYEANEKKEKMRFFVFYSVASLTSDPEAIPIHVQFERTDQSSLLIDFARIQLIPDANTGPLSDSNRVLLRNNNQLDPFTFPLVAGCSGELAKKAVDLFADRPRDKTRFSFKTEVEYMPKGEVRLSPVAFKLWSYVAFDAALNSLRIDLKSAATRSGVRRQLYNFKLNRMYHSVEVVPNSNTIVDKVVDLTNEGAESEVHEPVTRCQVGRILAPGVDDQRPQTSNDRLTIGKLLTGADKFVYMGKAQVRGIPARVYEAHLAALPFWRDQPMAYQTATAEWRLREPQVGAKPKAASVLYDIVLYVSEQEEHGPLLLMEVFKLEGKVSLFNERESIRFFDFLWDLEHQAPGGDRPSELFSLEDLCSAGVGENEYARVELLLESKATTGSAPNLLPPGADPDDQGDFKLGNSQARHLSLLASLQDSLNLPATMVYDLESKLLGAQESEVAAPSWGTGGQSQVVMAFSFRVAEHADNLVDLVYVGQGSLRAEYMSQGVLVHTFQACFFFAAHRRASTYFGYDMKSRYCFVDLDPAVGPFNHDEQPPTFVMSSGGTYEVYRTVIVDDPISVKTSDWLEDMAHSRSKLKVIGQNLKLLQIGPGNSDLDFIVRRARIDDRDYKSSSFGATSTKDLVRTDMIIGFGLIESARLCKRILPAPLLSTNQSPLSSYLKEAGTQMTQEQCQAACLSDMSCQSYSVCLRDAELKCITSQLSFKSESIMEQLNEAVGESHGTKRRRQLTITMDDVKPLELSQDANCQLYNKVYLNLFKEPKERRRDLNTRRLHPVQSEEDCARMCFQQNIKVLSQDLSHAKESIKGLLDAETGDLLEKEATSMRLAHRNVTKQLCKAFLYLDRLKLTGEMDETELRRRVAESDQHLTTGEYNGYCIVNDKPSKDLAETSAEKNHVVGVDVYRFRAEIFYEKQFGTALRRAGMTSDEHKAYRKVSSRQPLELEDKATMSLMRSMVALGDNFQERLRVDESACALGCFMQSWGPWPACRSFDIIYEQRVGDDRTRVTCYLNSITMHQAVETERYDLIQNMYPTQHQMWHFEPRPGFVLDASDLGAEAEEMESDFTEYLRSIKTRVKFHHFGVFIIIAIGLASGLVLGLKLGVILIARQRAQEDRETLFRTPITIEFSNQVNSEGVIP